MQVSCQMYYKSQEQGKKTGCFNFHSPSADGTKQSSFNQQVSWKAASALELHYLLQEAEGRCRTGILTGDREQTLLCLRYITSADVGVPTSTPKVVLVQECWQRVTCVLAGLGWRRGGSGRRVGGIPGRGWAGQPGKEM